jgi:hypothetical protein
MVSEYLCLPIDELGPTRSGIGKLTFQFEGKVIGEVATFVITSQEE